MIYYLENKNILIGISGGIAAYKIPLLVRLLKKAGGNVKVICTPSAGSFVTPGTLSTLSGNAVHSEFLDDSTGEWNNHVELGLWADIMLIAPCTANTLGKMAAGTSDNLLLATFMSAKCPVLFAPAMDLDMFEHQGVLENIKTLESYGHGYIEPATGELASGLVGKGRMPEPEELFEKISEALYSGKKWAGKKVVISAGPTHEQIDPVRFIGNYSSGKMGYSIATAFAEQGANVHLISGPTSLEDPKGVTMYRVKSADEMHALVTEQFKNADVAVMTAAVADYKPKTTSEQKIKKENTDSLSIELVKNPDILKTIGHSKQKAQYVVGFALETENELENAKGKLNRKNADMIVLNSANAAGGVFGSDENKVDIVTKKEVFDIPQMKKSKLAFTLCDIIFEEYESHS